MKILVRQVQTGLYLGRNGEWAEAIDAREFATIQEAGKEAAQRESAEVVLNYDKPKCELVPDPAYCAPDKPAQEQTRLRSP